MFFKKKYSVDMDTANQTLQNVFAACHQEPNTIPFDKLFLKGIAHTAFTKTGKCVGTAFLILTLFAPLAFRNPDFLVMSKGPTQQMAIEDHQLFTNEFVMTLNGSDIDYTHIYAKKADGSIVLPLYVNPATHTVSLPYDGETLNIYILDLNGNVLQAILSESKK